MSDDCICTICNHTSARESFAEHDCTRVLLQRIKDLEASACATTTAKIAGVDVCVWTHDAEDGCASGPWSSACGAYFEFNVGGPKDNGAFFCHKCGKPILASSTRPQPPEVAESILETLRAYANPECEGVLLSHTGVVSLVKAIDGLKVTLDNAIARNKSLHETIKKELPGFDYRGFCGHCHDEPCSC